MRQLLHPNVLPLYSSFVHTQNLWMVMPYVMHGSLLNIMKFSYPEVSEHACMRPGGMVAACHHALKLPHGQQPSTTSSPCLHVPKATMHLLSSQATPCMEAAISGATLALQAEHSSNAKDAERGCCVRAGSGGASDCHNPEGGAQRPGLHAQAWGHPQGCQGKPHALATGASVPGRQLQMLMQTAHHQEPGMSRAAHANKRPSQLAGVAAYSAA